MTTARTLGVLVVLAATLAGCTSTTNAVTSPTAAAGTTSTRTTPTSTTGTAVGVAALATLQVKGRAPMTGYRRSQFGPAWPTLSGCDARNRVLARDLTAALFRAGHCVVTEGTLVSPYTRAVIHFVRGPLSAQVQIDHVVALGDAWQTGAQSWTAARRQAFANDPVELLAVDGSSNEAKGDADAASWLPPNKAFRCTYAQRQVTIKAKYGLWVTPAEHDALARQLSHC